MQKTAYEMRISDWSSDVCSSELEGDGLEYLGTLTAARRGPDGAAGALAQGASRRFGYHRAVRRSAGRAFRRRRRRGAGGTGRSRGRGLRSEERRGGEECVSTCSTRWMAYH